MNRKRGLTTTEILSHAHPGGVRSLYIMGENPMMTEPNLNLTRHHMQQLEFLVAQDLFINESGAFADVFLPAASWAEKDGTFTNTDRRVQRVRQALRPTRLIAPRLADHLRPGKTYRSPPGSSTHRLIGIMPTPSEIMDEMRGVVPEYSGIKYSRIETGRACRCRYGTRHTRARLTCSPRPSPRAGQISPAGVCPRGRAAG